MEVVRKGLVGTVVLIYIDDLIIFSKNRAQLARDVKLVFDHLDSYDLWLNPKKCVFAQQEVKLLGYIMSAQGIKADPSRVSAIKEMPPPHRILNRPGLFLGWQIIIGLPSTTSHTLQVPWSNSPRRTQNLSGAKTSSRLLTFSKRNCAVTELWPIPK